MILFDAHVHIYDCFDLDLFFDAVFKNFHCNAEKLGCVDDCSCFLLLAESSGWYYFAHLQKMAVSEGMVNGRAWLIHETTEHDSLVVRHKEYPEISVVIVAGRQLITDEGLELLALVTGSDFSDGMRLDQAVDDVTASGGIPVCPWGAGKWLGKRGKILQNYMENNSSNPLHIGDSGGRPSLWPRPGILHEKFSGSRILSGSDPLPLVGEERRAGGYGGYMDAECSLSTPASSMREQLLNLNVPIADFGRQLCPLAFVQKQVALRLK